MKPFGIRSGDLASAMGVSKRTVRELIEGKRAVTADLALRLAGVLGTTGRFWLGLQCDFDLEVAARQGSEPPT
jgi:addiction module HigA family antidote